MKTIKLNSETKIDTGFTTPENYFENFASRVLLEIKENEEKKPIALYSKIKIWTVAVAAIFILGLLIPVYPFFENPMSKIDDKSLENYLVYSSSISDAELAYLLDNNDLEKISVELKVEDKIIENELTKNTDLEQYLLN
jgi:hypothetical protein